MPVPQVRYSYAGAMAHSSPPPAQEKHHMKRSSANSGPFRVKVVWLEVKNKKSRAELWRLIALALLHMEEAKEQEHVVEVA